MAELPVIQQPSCQCGHDGTEAHVLDVREIPHLIRHGAVLGSLRQLPAGASFILVAPHDPKPLLAQIQEEFGESVRHDYVQEGPDAWKIQLTKG